MALSRKPAIPPVRQLALREIQDAVFSLKRRLEELESYATTLNGTIAEARAAIDALNVAESSTGTRNSTGFTVPNSLTVNALAAVSATVTGDASVGGDLSVTGDEDIGGSLTINYTHSTGALTDGAALNAYGTLSGGTLSNTFSSVNALTTKSASATAPYVHGVRSRVVNSAGNTVVAYGLRSQVQVTGGSISFGYGLYIDSIEAGAAFGIYQDGIEDNLLSGPLSALRYTYSGLNGNGYFELTSQDATPSSPSGELDLRLYVDEEGRLATVDNDGHVTVIGQGTAPPIKATWTNAAGTALVASDAHELIAYIPQACSLAAIVVEDMSNSPTAGSCVIDIRKSTYTSGRPGTSICGPNKPTISSGVKFQDTTFTGYTATDFSAGDILILSLESSSVFKALSIQIFVQ